ncbi:MAG: murein biosynthesis integral membrane protein MurJ [Neisseriaceae bacterium]
MKYNYKALFGVSSLTFLSRILGLLRDNLIAQTFGIGFGTDAFYAANRIPNLLRRIFAEGAFSQVFVPFFTHYKKEHEEVEVQALVRNITGILSLILFIISVLGIIFSPVIVAILARGFLADAVKFELTTHMLRIVFPYIFFISLTTLMSGILNAYRFFSLPALVPILLNISIIVASLTLKDKFATPEISLAWGVFLGGVFQLVFQFPLIYKLGYLRVPSFYWTKEVRTILKRMIPGVLAVSVAQIAILVSTYFQSLMGNGGVSWIYYADRLMEFPTALLSVSLTVVLLPTLAHYAKDPNTEQEFKHNLDWGIRLSAYLTIPASMGLFVLSYPVICTLFKYGKFTSVDVQYTQWALSGYVIGLLPLGLVKILSSALYSHQNIRTPVKIAAISLVCTILFNALFFYLGFGVLGISLSITLGAYVNMVLLFFSLHRRAIYTLRLREHIGFFLKVLLGTIAMGEILHWILPYFKEEWSMSATTRLVHLLLLVVVGSMVYFGSTYLIGTPLPKQNSLK